MYLLYAFATPNSVKAAIALEELGVAYELVPINVRKGEQKAVSFLELNPNGKVPVLIDNESKRHEPIVESAAILVYLAEKHGQLLPTAGIGRTRVFEQLFFHASALAPAFGQAGFFLKNASEKMPLAIERFHGEAQRILKLLDRLLAERRHVAGDLYSIADIAHFGWFWRRAFANVDFSEAPHVARWYDEVSKREPVQRAIERLVSLAPPSA
jgi:GST-like protein